MTPTKTADIAAEADRLRAQAEEAAARAAEATRRAEEAAKKAEERREAEIMAIRRRRLEEYDEAAFVAEEQEARRAFEEAVIADKGAVAAFIAWQVVSSRRYLAATEARSAQTVLEPNASPVPVPGPPGAVFIDEVQRVIARAVANATEDLRDDLQAELDRAGR